MADHAENVQPSLNRWDRVRKDRSTGNLTSSVTSDNTTEICDDRQRVHPHHNDMWRQLIMLTETDDDIE